ncbi:MAG: nickel pincer cofactor biosynthesis protein LarC [Chthoniobacteraceae bacterium]|jgi:uncharacterized protein (TIGR00299 family) protein
MRTLYLDCFSGISGDMTVGALCDLGIKPSAFEWELGKLDIGDFHAHWEREKRQGIDGVKFTIHEGATHKHGHGHDHHHDEHEHHHEREHEHHHHEHEEHHHHHGRGFREIRDLIEKSGLSDFVKRRATGIFERIAKAEGKIHGMKPDEVTFHEVGALDSIADIVLACVGIELLKVDRVVASPLAEGRGWVDAAHGRFPVPAPATLEILKGLPLASVDEPFEFITPTGAAIVAEFAETFGPMPALKIEKIGYGCGSRESKTRPNVLRAVLGEAVEAAGPAGYERDTLTRIETNIDDLSPEIVGAVTEQLLKAGALDVFLTSIQMKKNRPGLQLTALCEDAAVSAVAGLIFRQTTTFGVRMDRVDRLKLPRTFETVKTPYGPVSVKIGSLNGETLQVSPEFESCKALSEKTGQPIRTIFEAAIHARSGKT